MILLLLFLPYYCSFFYNTYHADYYLFLRRYYYFSFTTQWCHAYAYDMMTTPRQSATRYAAITTSLLLSRSTITLSPPFAIIIIITLLPLLRLLFSPLPFIIMLTDPFIIYLPFFHYYFAMSPHYRHTFAHATRTHDDDAMMMICAMPRYDAAVTTMMLTPTTPWHTTPLCWWHHHYWCHYYLTRRSSPRHATTLMASWWVPTHIWAMRRESAILHDEKEPIYGRWCLCDAMIRDISYTIYAYFIMLLFIILFAIIMLLLFHIIIWRCSYVLLSLFTMLSVYKMRVFMTDMSIYILCYYFIYEEHAMFEPRLLRCLWAYAQRGEILLWRWWACFTYICCIYIIFMRRYFHTYYSRQAHYCPYLPPLVFIILFYDAPSRDPWRWYYFWYYHADDAADILMPIIFHHVFTIIPRPTSTSFHIIYYAMTLLLFAIKHTPCHRPPFHYFTMPLFADATIPLSKHYYYYRPRCRLLPIHYLNAFIIAIIILLPILSILNSILFAWCRHDITIIIIARHYSAKTHIIIIIILPPIITNHCLITLIITYHVTITDYYCPDHFIVVDVDPPRRCRRLRASSPTPEPRFLLFTRLPRCPISHATPDYWFFFIAETPPMPSRRRHDYLNADGALRYPTADATRRCRYVEHTMTTY